MIRYTPARVEQYLRLEASFESFVQWLGLPFSPALIELQDGVDLSHIPERDIVYAQAWVMWKIVFGPPDNQIVWLNSPLRAFDRRPFIEMAARVSEEVSVVSVSGRAYEVLRAENNSYLHLLSMTENSLRGRTITHLVLSGQKSEGHVKKILNYAGPMFSFRDSKVIRIMPRSEV